MLLSYNHRLALQRRSRPPPPISSRKPSTPPLQLLRPIATQLTHHEHTRQLHALLARLCRLSASAGLPASFRLAPLVHVERAVLAGVKAVVDAFAHVLDSEAAVTLPGGWHLAVALRTALQRPPHGSQWTVRASHDGAAARLLGESRFAAAPEMAAHLWWCFGRSVVNHVRQHSPFSQLAHPGGSVLVLGAGAGAGRGVGGAAAGGGGGAIKYRRVRVEVLDDVGLVLAWVGSGGVDEKFVWDGSSDKGHTLAQVLATIAAS